MAQRLELPPQRHVIVDFAVIRDPNRSRFIRKRLPPAFDVDNAQASVCEHEIGRRTFRPRTGEVTHRLHPARLRPSEQPARVVGPTMPQAGTEASRPVPDSGVRAG